MKRFCLVAAAMVGVPLLVPLVALAAAPADKQAAFLSFLDFLVRIAGVGLQGLIEIIK